MDISLPKIRQKIFRKNTSLLSSIYLYNFATMKLLLQKSRVHKNSYNQMQTQANTVTYSYTKYTADRLVITKLQFWVTLIQKLLDVSAFP